MINEPSVDEMIRKLATDGNQVSRYALCTVASKRARQLISIDKSRGETREGKDKELLSACKEISSGKVVIAKD